MTNIQTRQPLHSRIRSLTTGLGIMFGCLLLLTGCPGIEPDIKVVEETLTLKLTPNTTRRRFLVQVVPSNTELTKNRLESVDYNVHYSFKNEDKNNTDSSRVDLKVSLSNTQVSEENVRHCFLKETNCTWQETGADVQHGYDGSLGQDGNQSTEKNKGMWTFYIVTQLTDGAPVTGTFQLTITFRFKDQTDGRLLAETFFRTRVEEIPVE